MRGRLLAIVAAAAAVFALAFAGSASAGTGYGYAGYSFGGPCIGCNVQIHDYTTDTNGSTISDGNGTYSFSGLIGTHHYGVTIWTCKVHSHFSSPWAFFVGSPTSLPPLYASGDGAC